MAIIVMRSELKEGLVQKKVEIVKIEEKYYIELDEFEDSECIIELSISLSAENDLLRERINILEAKIKILERGIKL
jgi:hypothetical protein